MISTYLDLMKTNVLEWESYEFFVRNWGQNGIEYEAKGAGIVIIS